jgi:hypothetical protein
MIKNYVDLKPYFNDRLVYPEKEFLTDSGYYTEEKFRFGEIEREGLSARLERTAGLLDNVICEKQAVAAGGVLCDSVILFGACCWGYYKEDFLLEFSDGTSATARACFYDRYWPITPLIVNSLELNAKELGEYNHIFVRYPKHDDKDNYCFLYYYKTDLAVKGRKLKQITFPDNMFMNIFAITVYGEE